MDDLVERQRQKIEELRERVRQLEECLSPSTVDVPLEWRLTSKEARVYAHLTTRKIADKKSIMMALYSDRPEEEPEQNIVDVFICKMRRKLAPFNIRIETIWGQGYALAQSEGGVAP